MSLPVTLPEAAVMMEDHDKAYKAWKERGVLNRVLVHIDAHIDFGWVPEMDMHEIGAGDMDMSGPSKHLPLLNPYLNPRDRMVNIGNYICPAIRDGMVKKFYWVVPDKSWRTARGKKHILKQLKQILKIKRSGCSRPEVHADHMSCRIFDTELIVTSLENLGCIEEPVLLDIDVDFMLTQHIWDDLNPGRRPWISPEELFEKISSGIKDIDVLTIAYSVEGGFTPLRFKYLGDELRLLFENRLSDRDRALIMHKRKALLFENQNKRAEAAAEYEKALSIDDADASAYFNLFLLALDGDQDGSEKAKHFYGQALIRDRSYATVYNNSGILYLRCNRLKEAQAEYNKLLGLDQFNAAVLNGLGHISLVQRRYTSAAEFFDRCLLADQGYPEAMLGKAIVDYKQGRLDEAQKLLEHFSKDHPDDAESYWWLGRIAQKRKNLPLAMDHFKRAVMHGGEGPLIHLVMARLCLARGFYYRAFEEFKRTLRALRISF